MERVARNRSDLEALEGVIRFVCSFDFCGRLMANGWMPTDQIQSLRLFSGASISHFLRTLVLWTNVLWLDARWQSNWCSSQCIGFMAIHETFRCIRLDSLSGTKGALIHLDDFDLNFLWGQGSTHLKSEGNLPKGSSDMLPNNQPTDHDHVTTPTYSGKMTRI